MKSKAKLIFSLFIISTAFMACYKAPDADSRLKKIAKCHERNNMDSALISQKLLGTWEWYYITYYWTPENNNYTEHDGLKLKFNKDNTVDVSYNGQLSYSTTWTVRPQGAAYILETNSFRGEIYGNIYICSNDLVFSNSHLDGDDLYYERVD